MRVLNIVVEECRTLASRERCPFLIHLEVAETGLNGNDSRLFAAGAQGLGATVKEALSLSAAAASTSPAKNSNAHGYGHASYQIPPELLEPHPTKHDHEEWNDEERGEHIQDSDYVRGGWQSNETTYYSSHTDPDDILNFIPYDEVRQNQYEQLHHQMYSDQRAMVAPAPRPAER